MAERATTQMSTKGQVVLPKAVRERRGWRAGDKFVIEERPEGVLLRRADEETHTRYEDVAGCLGPFPRVVSIEEMNQAVLDEAGAVGGVRDLLEIDTNVLVRYLMADDPDQFRRAARALEMHEARVSATVLLETEWVLRSVYRQSPDEIVKALRAFLRLPRVVTESRTAIFDALSWAEAGMEFADALHLAGAGDVEGFLSFDRDLARQAKRLGAPPVREP